MALGLGSRLTEITQVANAAGAVYTNAAATTTYVHVIILYNVNTTAETVQIWNVPDSTGVGTAADANKFLEIELAADETVQLEFPGGLILEDEDDTIQAATTTASKVTIQIYGQKDA